MFQLMVAFMILVPTAIVCWICWHLWKKGPRGRITAVCLVGAIVGLFVVNESRSRAANARIEAQRALLDSMLRSSLNAGDGAEKIESAMTNAGLKYSYQGGVLGGYYSMALTEEKDTWIQIVVYVDEEKKMKTIVVQTCYTSL